MLASTGKPFHLVPLNDVADDADWMSALDEAVRRVTGERLDVGSTVLHTANVEVAALFERAGFRVQLEQPAGHTPLELIQRIVDGRAWQDDASPGTRALFGQDGMVERLRAIYAQRLINDDGELAEHRDFNTYSNGMDASLEQKIVDVAPWVLPGRVVDKGCGTGKLMEALTRQFPASAFVGVDLSREFLRRSDQNTYASDDVTLVFGDASDVQVEPGTATTVLFASIMHEIYTYNGYDLGHVDRALRSAARELKPGGRVIIRDGVSPGPAMCRMKLLDARTEQVWGRFSVEFKHGQGAPHEVLPDGTLRLSSHLANEFLCKKDYAENWAIEVHEEYGALTPDGWREALDRAGFDTLHVNAYVIGWIAKNR
ncbi:MAG: methyltransferase domain-containing protein, partial [Myxococcales bacterium]